MNHVSIWIQRSDNKTEGEDLNIEEQMRKVKEEESELQKKIEENQAELLEMNI